MLDSANPLCVIEHETTPILQGDFIRQSSVIESNFKHRPVADDVNLSKIHFSLDTKYPWRNGKVNVVQEYSTVNRVLKVIKNATTLIEKDFSRNDWIVYV